MQRRRLFCSRRVTTAADYLRAMREQQGQKRRRGDLPMLAASGVLDLRPADADGLYTCRPTSWRICFGGALR